MHDKAIVRVVDDLDVNLELRAVAGWVWAADIEAGFSTSCGFPSLKVAMVTASPSFGGCCPRKIDFHWPCWGFECILTR